MGQLCPHKYLNHYCSQHGHHLRYRPAESTRQAGHLSDEQALAHDGADLDCGVGLGGLLQRKCLPDDRLDPAGGGFPQRSLDQSPSVPGSGLGLLDTAHGNATAACLLGVNGVKPPLGGQLTTVGDDLKRLPPQLSSHAVETPPGPRPPVTGPNLSLPAR